MTQEPLLHTRVRKDITHPEPQPNHRRNCTNMLGLGTMVLGLCVHSQPRAPTSHHRRLLTTCSNTAAHLHPASAPCAASLPSPLKPLVFVYRHPELLLAACRHVLHALVQHLLPLQSLHDLSLILPQFVCRLCPVSQHTELSLYSYRLLTCGCSGPRTHPLPLYTSIQPPCQLSAFGPLTLPGGLTLR